MMKQTKEQFGEGNYTAARNFRRDEEEFVHANKGRVEAMGQDAEKALDGAEGEELHRAEREARDHSKSK